MKDIADLRKTQYEQAGQKAQVGENRLTLGTVLGIAGLLLVIIGIAVSALLATR